VNNNETGQSYNLAVLSTDPKHVFELVTTSNSVIPISIKAIQELTPVPANQRPPTMMEITKCISTALGQSADPYSNECGLMPVFAGGFHYEVWVAAQVRMRKAQAQKDYKGFSWGWITKDFTRHETGRKSKANPTEIIGAWGEVLRAGLTEPYYHEIFISEYQKKSQSGKGKWEQAVLTMTAKVIRDQTHKFAYADKMGNLNTFDELRAYNEGAEDILPPPANDVPPRNDRRKKVENETIEPEDKSVDSLPQDETAEQEAQSQGQEPADDTDGGKEAEDAGNFDELRKNVYRKYKVNGGVQNHWLDFAGYALGLETDDVTKDKLTEDMLKQIDRFMDTEGVPDAAKEEKDAEI